MQQSSLSSIMDTSTWRALAKSPLARTREMQVLDAEKPSVKTRRALAKLRSSGVEWTPAPSQKSAGKVELLRNRTATEMRTLVETPKKRRLGHRLPTDPYNGRFPKMRDYTSVNRVRSRPQTWWPWVAMGEQCKSKQTTNSASASWQF